MQAVGVGLALYKRLLNRESRVLSKSRPATEPSIISIYLFIRWSLIAQPGSDQPMPPTASFLWATFYSAHRHTAQRACSKWKLFAPAHYPHLHMPLSHKTVTRVYCLLQVTWRHNNASHLCCSLLPSCTSPHYQVERGLSWSFVLYWCSILNTLIK